MAINVFYNIEHYTLPQVFYHNKTNFFMGVAYNKGFLHQTCNSFFDMAFKKGVIKIKRKFNAKDFKISETTYDDKHKLLCIRLPKPKKCDNTDTYLESYFLSFLEYDNKIEVLDIYALRKCNSKQERFFFISFNSRDDDKIVFRGIVEDEQSKILEYMYKVAFEDFYPRVSLSSWDDLM